jgi:endonuclease/exonuclease/phosphatase family metal-dependent hydrolase
MRLLPLALLLLAACGPSGPRPQDRGATAAAVVRLVTWNVHDLFDQKEQPGSPGLLDLHPSAAEVEARLRGIAAVLAALDADVVLLQEVEDLPLLRRLADRAGFPEARLVEGNDPRGIDVGLLSRLPVQAYLSHADDLGPDGRRLWPRDAVEAVLDAGGRRLLLLGTHLSSRLSDPAGARRRLQAARLRELADLAVARWTPRLALVGGDLNAEQTEAALEPLLGDGGWLDADGAAGPEGWTWTDGASRASLDHLIFRACDASALLAAGAAGGREALAASDHRPVLLDLLVP